MKLISIFNPKFENLKEDLETISRNLREHYTSKIAIDACMSFDDSKDISSPEMAKLNQAIQIATEKAVAEYYLALNGHKYARAEVNSMLFRQEFSDERPKITWQNV